jgi:hypothetical protein
VHSICTESSSWLIPIAFQNPPGQASGPNIEKPKAKPDNERQ